MVSVLKVELKPYQDCDRKQSNNGKNGLSTVWELSWRAGSLLAQAKLKTLENNRHYAVIDHYNRKLSLSRNGELVAESSRALILKEVGHSVYNPVFYFPKADVKIALEKEQGKSTHCPIKGHATYWLPKGETVADYFAWSYENALPKSKKIEGYVAFNIKYLIICSEPI